MYVNFGIHAYVADLKAAMQLYDRPSCTNSTQPCFTQGCTYGSLDVVTQTYVKPEDSLMKRKGSFKTIGRSLCQFQRGSIWRALPFIGAYANDILFPNVNKHEKIVTLVEEYMETTLSNEDKEKVLSLFTLLHSFGPLYFPMQFMEVGNFEKQTYVREMDKPNANFKERRHLVNLVDSSPIPLDCAYACDFMHGITNFITTIVTYLLSKRDSKEDNPYPSIFYFLNNRIPHDEFFKNMISSPPFLFSGIKDTFNQFDFSKCINISDLFDTSHFKKLTSHKRMLFAFQLFPLVFQKSFYDTRVRSVAYVFLLLDALYGADRDLQYVQDLCDIMYLMFAVFEGVTPESLMTLSMHMMLHAGISIRNCGPLIYTSTFSTERSYQWDKDNNIASQNRDKTSSKKMTVYQIVSLIDSINKLRKQKVPSYTYEGHTESIWPALYENSLLQLLTIRNFQDSLVFSRCDYVPFVTGLDVYIDYGYSVPDGFEKNCFLPSDLINNINWNNVQRWKTSINYNNKCYEVYKSINFAENGMKEPPGISFIRTWDRKLHIFLIMGFVTVMINNLPFPQAIVYDVKTTSISSIIESYSIRCIHKDDFKPCDRNRFCLVNVDRLYFEPCHLFVSSSSDYIFFIPNKLVVKQFSVPKNTFIYDSVKLY